MKKERKPRINLEHVLDEYMKSGGDGPTEIDPVRHHIPYLVVALEKCYEREDALVSAIKELCDSEDSTGCSGDLTVVSLDPMLKLYELASE
jgi:hypothetical protein